jgi:hypothetical protein
MSYILDALNKSERERSRKLAPGISVLQGDDHPIRYGIKHFLAALVLLAFINSAGVYFYFGDRGSTSPSPEAIVDRTPTPATTNLSEIPSQPSFPVHADPVDINALPSSVRNRLPELEVTAHIYSSEAVYRMVKINGVARHEGEQLNATHRLLEITESGLILKFESYVYILDIIEDWQIAL